MNCTQAPCPDCGAPLGGREGCDRAFHELGAQAAASIERAYRRRAVVDAYCLQHPAYIQSVKSFAAHLCGLCASVERANDPRAERAIWSTIRVPPGGAKPIVVHSHWTQTVANVMAAHGAADFRRAVDAWIADVWSAWAPHHALAQEWLDYSIQQLGREKR